jgi:hypothetical protein
MSGRICGMAATFPKIQFSGGGSFQFYAHLPLAIQVNSRGVHDINVIYPVVYYMLHDNVKLSVGVGRPSNRSKFRRVLETASLRPANPNVRAPERRNRFVRSASNSNLLTHWS